MLLILFFVCYNGFTITMDQINFDNEHVLSFDQPNRYLEIEISVENDYCNVFMIDGVLYREKVKASITRKQDLTIQSIGPSKINGKVRNLTFLIVFLIPFYILCAGFLIYCMIAPSLMRITA